MSIQDPREIEKVKIVMLKGEKGEQGDVSVAQMESAISEAVGAETTLRQQADATLERLISEEADARENADALLDSTKADKSQVNELATDKADKTALASEVSARTSADITINARIDEIIAPSGEAPSVAEVTDARVGADGKTYASLGTAIRTQNNMLSSNIGYDTPFTDNAKQIGIISSNLWAYTDDDRFTYIIIPISSGDIIDLQASLSTCSIAFLKTYTTPVSGESPDFSSIVGYTTVLEVFSNKKAMFTVPLDANYLYVLTSALNGDRTPSYLYINGVNMLSSVFAQFKQYKGIVDKNLIPLITDFNQYEGYISSSKWTNINTTNNKYIIIPISSGDNIVVCSKSSTSVIAVLRSYSMPSSNDTPDFSTTASFTDVINVITGSTIQFIAPSDAKFLYVYMGTNNARMPELIIINGNSIYNTLPEIIANNNVSRIRIMQYNVGKYTWGQADEHLTSSNYDDIINGYKNMLSKYHPDIISIEEYLESIDVEISENEYETYDMNDELWSIPYYYEAGSSESQRMVKSKFPAINKIVSTHDVIVNSTTYKITYVETSFLIDNKVIVIICTALPYQPTDDAMNARQQHLTWLLEKYAKFDYVFIALDMNISGNYQDGATIILPMEDICLLQRHIFQMRVSLTEMKCLTI